LLRGTPESRSASASQHKLDVGGLLSLIVALVLVNLFISKGHGWGWSSPLSLTMLAGRWRGAVFIRSGCAKARRR
jgi:DHA2 family multidrug resistance protein-like MFS transporter